MEERKIIPAQRPFMYKGRKVIGAYAPTKAQFIKTYSLIWLYSAALIYVVIRGAICSCLWLTLPQSILVMVVTLFTFLSTAALKRKFERQNFVYEEE